MLTRINYELVQLRQELSYFFTFLRRSDQLCLLAASFMLLGLFMPWLSADGHFTQIGLMGGGDVHLILAIFTLLQIKKVGDCQIKALRKPHRKSLIAARLRRISLSYMGVGIVSTTSAIFILFYFGTQYITINNIVDVRMGFYITTCSGIFIFFCGLERFWH